MITHKCRVSHDPANGKFGDCVRASVASILDIEEVESVPHFFEDNPPANIGQERLKAYLALHGLMLFTVWFDGQNTLDDILTTMKMQNPDMHYLLFGATDEGDHVVICCNDKIVHNTAWYANSLTRAGSNSYWAVVVFVPAVLAAS